MSEYPSFVVDEPTTRAIQSALKTVPREVATLTVEGPLGPQTITFYTGKSPEPSE